MLRKILIPLLCVVVGGAALPLTTPVENVPVTFSVEVKEMSDKEQQCFVLYKAKGQSNATFPAVTVPEKILLTDVEMSMMTCKPRPGTADATEESLPVASVTAGLSALERDILNWIPPQGTGMEIKDLVEEVANDGENALETAVEEGKQLSHSFLKDVETTLTDLPTEIGKKEQQLQSTLKSGENAIEEEATGIWDTVTHSLNETWDKIQHFYRLFLYTLEVIGGLVVLVLAWKVYNKLRKLYKFGKHIFSGRDGRQEIPMHQMPPPPPAI